MIGCVGLVARPFCGVQKALDEATLQDGSASHRESDDPVKLFGSSIDPRLVVVVMTCCYYC